MRAAREPLTLVTKTASSDQLTMVSAVCVCVLDEGVDNFSHLLCLLYVFSYAGDCAFVLPDELDGIER